MSDGAFGSFRDIVADVLAQSKHDPIRHVLVLTYEFDEQQLLNLVCGRSLEEDFELRQKQMKILADMRPLVIYDARKTGPCSKLPQFLELHPFKAAPFACHHSKGYLIITEKTVRLVLGSFNLTHSGLFHNREVFEAFHWDAESTSSLTMLAEWTDFLEHAYGPRFGDSTQLALAAVVATLRTRLAAWQAHRPDDDATHLLSSGYGEESGLDALRTHWDRWYPGTEPKSVVAVSPFFDSMPQHSSFATSLCARFPRLDALTIVTDELKTPQLSQAHFGPINHRTLYIIPRALGDVERDRIERASRQDRGSAKDLIIVRALHAKVLLLRSEHGCLAYLGSANFTRKAWEGANQELGVVWKVDDAQALYDMLMHHLAVEPRNLAPTLPLEREPSAVGEDEEYAGPAHFPEFIAGIRIVPNEDISQVRFEFDLTDYVGVDSLDALRAYRVEWAGLELLITDGRSQWISREEFQTRLIGGRNLRMTYKAPDSEPVWLPYCYAGNLIAERETFLHPTSLDWIAFYLDPERDWQGEDSESIPGEGGTQDAAHALREVDAVSRAENCVIAMQAYLNLFSRVERDFRSRLQEIAALDRGRQPERLKLLIAQPLAGLCTLLEHEATWAPPGAPPKTVSQTDIFKLGELSLFVDALAEQAGSDLAVCLVDLQDRLRNVLQRWQAARAGQLQNRYIEFVLQKEVA